MSLQVQGPRIYVGDVQESVHMMRYKKQDNQLYIFADDVAPRYLTAVLPLDYDTVASADKFGNIAVQRLPKEVSQQVHSGGCRGGCRRGGAGGSRGGWAWRGCTSKLRQRAVWGHGAAVAAAASPAGHHATHT